MMTQLQTDAAQHPELFQWNGSIPEQRLLRWLKDRALVVPEDLLRLWTTTGGGELFETETLLAPNRSTDPGSDLDSVNQLHWESGLPTKYLIFSVGAFGLSAIRLADGNYVLLDDEGYSELSEFTDLADWYSSTIRSEYAQRYGLE